MTAAPELIDLRHLGRPHVIGSWLVGDVLVDPGPASCHEELLRGLSGRRPRAIALTHIHLDHAGGTGTLVRELHEVEVWVHERGARHLVDPSRLLASATRLYGDEMERKWGEVAPVPQDNLRVLEGGERLDGFAVAYTPGHASHHVSYLHEESGFAFTGDVAGVRIAGGPVLAPTPPPDIDLEAWEQSIRQLEAWAPETLAVTHFGAYGDVAEQLAALRERLARGRELALAGDLDGFARELREKLADGEAGAYQQALPPDQSFAGLVRYVERRAEGRD